MSLLQSLPTIWKVKIINGKKFDNIELDKNIQILVIYIIFLGPKLMIPVYKAKIFLLFTEKVIILAKYFVFVNMFLKKLRINLLQY